METQTDKAVIREYLLQKLPLIPEEEPAVRRSVRIFRNRFEDREINHAG